MNHFLKSLVVGFCLFLGAVSAAATSPIGKWKTIDDDTKEAKAIVEIFEEGGVLKGKIIERFSKPGDKENCEKCTGDLKDKPILGMVFLWGFKDKGEEWGDGEILDPKNGKIYSAKMEVIEGGAKLKLRGYILGMPFLGRSQVWEKVP